MVLKNTKGLIEKFWKLRELDEEEINDVEIGSIIRSAVSKDEDRLEDENIDLEFVGTEGKVRAGSSLEKVFFNLRENSIPYADCDRTKVAGKDERDEIMISLEDVGEGIPEEIKDKVFDKGFRKGETIGIGLGSYMVKEIAKSYGGSVDVKDSDKGGARFDVRLKKP